MPTRLLLSCLCLLLSLLPLSAQPFYEFETLAGSRELRAGTDGPRGSGNFRLPTCAAIDSRGNVYVGDNGLDSGWVRKVTPDGTLTTISPDMGEIRGIAVDTNDTVFISLATCIRKRDSSGNWVTVAGQLGSSGLADGPALQATIKYAGDLIIAKDGTLFFMDAYGDLVRRLSRDGYLSTIAGSSPQNTFPLLADGQGAAARFYGERPIGFDQQGNLLLAGRDNRVRVVSPEGLVSSLMLTRSDAEEANTSQTANYNTNSLACTADGGFLWLHDGLLSTVGPDKLCTLRAGHAFMSTASLTPSQNFDAGSGGGMSFEFVNHRLLEIPTAARTAGWSIYLLSENGVLLRGRQTALPAPPIVLTPGKGPTFLGVNRNYSLQISAVGQTELSYQWFHNGDAIQGATQAHLDFSSLAETDSGTYSVRLTAGGSLQVNFADFLVWAPPVLGLSLRHETPGGQMLWDIAGGEGRLVAVGTGGCILNSSDGDKWTRVNSGTTVWLVSICRGPDGFVAVGDQGTILLSADGLSWRPAASSGTSERLNRVAYSDGLYIIVGEHGTILSSADAEHWTLRHSGGGWLHGLGRRLHNVDLITAIDGTRIKPTWVCAGQDGRVLMSADGLEWHDFQGPAEDIECLIPGDYYRFFTAFGARGTISTAYGYYLPGFHNGPYNGVQLYNLTTQMTGLPVRFRGAANGAGTTFILGEQGTVISYNSSYESYAVLPSHTTATLLGGAYLGNSMYILGENETILRSSPYEASRLSNLSSLGHTGTGENTLVSGLSISGSQPKQLLVRGAGPALQPFGVSNWAQLPTLSLFDSASASLSSAGALAKAANKALLLSTAQSLGAFPFTEDALDSALLARVPPGTYTFHLNSDGSQGAALLEIYDADDLRGEPRLGNLSTRGRVSSTQPDLTAGLVINGQATRRILVRAIGPGLKAFGIQNPIPDPVVRVYASGNWQYRSLGAWEAEANPLEAKDAASAVGAFALAFGSADAAAVLELPPGPCTFRASSASGKEGIVLIEIYDLP